MWAGPAWLATLVGAREDTVQRGLRELRPREGEEAEPLVLAAADPADVVLLREIRDELRARRAN